MAATTETEPAIVLEGDVRETLRRLPDASVHCCVTSPPYYGLRDYGTGTWEGGDEGCDHKESRPFVNSKNTLGHNGHLPATNSANMMHQRQYREVCGKCGARRADRQIGLEPTPAEYVAQMVAVFEEVRRVLRPDGTLWLNLGNSYNAYNGNRGKSTSFQAASEEALPELPKGFGLTVKGMKPKDLLGIPWRVAFALQDAGWYLRQDIIWAKPNPMPESVRDRCTKSHEYLFLLAKSPRYYFDAEAIAEPCEYQGRGTLNVGARRKLPKGTVGGQSGGSYVVERDPEANRNRRSVWTVVPDPYPGAHFAVMPPELVRPCVLAGTSERGCCPACGSPWVRMVERGESHYRAMGKTGRDKVPTDQKPPGGGGNTRTANGTVPSFRAAAVITRNWQPSCDCPPADPVPCVVLDPFAGSGTTLAVAVEERRRAVGCELNPEYAKLIRRRLAKTTPRLFVGG